MFFVVVIVYHYCSADIKKNINIFDLKSVYTKVSGHDTKYCIVTTNAWTLLIVLSLGVTLFIKLRLLNLGIK